MQRLKNEEDGAIAVLVALSLIVLFGFGALAVDVGQIYQERRELQNGADAAALASAQDCADGDPLVAAACAVTPVADDCDATTALLQGRIDEYANANANDGASNACVYELDLIDQFITVETATLSGGNNFLTHWLAGVLGHPTTSVEVQATAVWGPLALGSYDTLPLVLSKCEYEKYVDNPANTYPADEPWSETTNGPVQTVYFHGSAEPCHDSTSGMDIPGGFGWLDNTGTCEADIDDDGWVGEDPGASPDQTVCSPALMEDNVLNKIILLPVFDGTNGLTGNNGEYHAYTYAAFYVTGYNFGGQYKRTSNDAVTGTPLPTCTGSDRCIVGWFTEATMSDGTVDPDGPDTGVTSVQLTK